MAIQVKKKEVMESYNCVKLLNGELEPMLKSIGTDYYTCGKLGWNSDIYFFPEYSMCISSGSRSFGFRPSNELLKHYREAIKETDERIEKNFPKHTTTDRYVMKKDAYKKLLAAFLEEALEEYYHEKWGEKHETRKSRNS